MEFAKLQTNETQNSLGEIFLSPHHISEPLGKLLVLIEYQHTDVSMSAHLSDLIEYVSDLYYEEIEDQESVDTEQHLENIAVEVHKSIGEYFPEEDPDTLEEHLNVFIGVMQNTTLTFTKTSNVHLMLYHGQHLIPIDEDEEDGSSSGLFSYITSGPITENSSILITTESLLDYFSENKLKHILGNHNARAAVSELQKLIDEFTKQTVFQAIIIQNKRKSTADPVTKVVTGRQTSDVSMSNLNVMEADTNTVLTNSLVQNTQKSLRAISGALGGLLKRRPQQRRAPEQESTSSEVPPSMHAPAYDEARKRRMREKSIIRSLVFKSTNALIDGSKRLVQLLGSLLKGLLGSAVSLTRNRKTIVRTVQKTSQDLPGAVSKAVTKKLSQYRSLNTKRRKLLYVIIGLAVILIVSSAIGLTRNSGSQSREEVQLLLEEIEVKRSSAEAALIYGNEDKAVSLIAEARRLLSGVDAGSSGDLFDKKSELAQSLFDSYKKIQHLEDIPAPVLRADISLDEETGAFRDVKFIAGSSDTFYGYDTNQNLYEFDLANSSVDLIGALDTEIKSLNVFSDTQLLVHSLDPEARAYIINLATNEADQIGITFNNTLTEKPALTPYFSRLYVLDPRDRQIYKHSRLGSTYTRGEAWVTDNTVDLSDATHMAIDGNIWTVTASGNLYKLAGGVSQDFEIQALDPQLNSPNFVWTSIDSNRLYILDPPTRRVIIVNKEDGTIFKQFVSERFDDLRSAVVDEKNNKMYLLNESKVYEVAI